MRHRWASLWLVLALSAIMPHALSAQGTETPGRGSRGVLKQNYPNPFNPETRIPFTIGDEPCTNPSRQYRVTLRIYNILSQPIAVPVLQGGTGGVAGKPLDGVMLTCGEYTAYWDGKVRNTTREAASGVYLYRLQVDNSSVSRKMIVVK